MPIEIVTIPCLSDNYAFLVHATETGCTAVIDVPEAAPIAAALDAKGWRLTDIWVTHHHDDHIQGIAGLHDRYDDLRVVGSAADAHRLPPLSKALAFEEPFDFYGYIVDTINVPGHTVGHVAFHLKAANAAFTGDSLMALGCGRLFEGTPAQMWDSLKRLRALPSETIVYSGHEYTASNARFALTIEPENSDLISRSRAVAAAREVGQPTVPSTLADELATNPFLRADIPELATAINMAGASPEAVFTEVRARKDSF